MVVSSDSYSYTLRNSWGVYLGPPIKTLRSLTEMGIGVQYGG